MRRILFLAVATTVLVLASMSTTAHAARTPLALGIASQSSTDLEAVDAFEASMGVRPATWTLWSTWGDRGGSAECIEGMGTCAFPTALAAGLRERGITPLVYWQPAGTPDPEAGRFERYRTIIQGRHDRYIRTWARAARDHGGPVIVRFAHEMNGTWFPWSLDMLDNSPAGFVRAWRHVVSLFREVGARNVRFLWSPFQRCGTCSRARYEEFYPGNAYVDYVGVSVLNWGDATWTPLSALIAEPLGTMRDLTATRRTPLGKPVILPEIGSNWIGGDKAGWITEGYLYAFGAWPRISAMVYFDYDTTFAAQPDWRLVQPPDGSAFAAYQSLALRPEFRAAFPLRRGRGPDGWRLMPLAEAPPADQAASPSPAATASAAP